MSRRRWRHYGPNFVWISDLNIINSVSILNETVHFDLPWQVSRWSSSSFLCGIWRVSLWREKTLFYIIRFVKILLLDFNIFDWNTKILKSRKKDKKILNKNKDSIKLIYGQPLQTRATDQRLDLAPTACHKKKSYS